MVLFKKTHAIKSHLVHILFVKMLFSVFLLLLRCLLIFGFNFDIRNPIVYENVNNSEYFGLTIEMYKDNSMFSEIYVGAPKANFPSKNLKSENSGVVYHCEITVPCKVLQLNLKDEFNYDGAFIGGAMDINFKEKLLIVSGYKSYQSIADDNLAKGVLFWSTLNKTQGGNVAPFLNYLNVVKDNDRTIYSGGMAEAGFSLHVPKNSDKLIVGAPGVHDAAGLSIKYSDIHEEPIYPREQFIYDTLVSNGYFAYSISSGYFFNQNQLLYVGGAPSINQKGMILIYDFPKVSDKNIFRKYSHYGVQVGESFGSAIATGDLNNDGYDDIIVGSPFYRSKDYNEGRIYILLGTNMSRGMSEPDDVKYIDGSATNGQFGTAIQYINDIDFDGYGDIAVSAPYEEDCGVVYIYKGTKSSLEPTYSQRIVGKDIHAPIKGFGISFSKPIDIDDNDYYDIAVGAYLSGHAVVLRARPLVVVNAVLTPSQAALNKSFDRFEVTACYSFKSHFPISENITLQVTLTVDEELMRVEFFNQEDRFYDVILREKQNVCRNITFLLKNVTDFMPITLTHVYKFIDTEELKPKKFLLISNDVKGENSFCLRCPLIDKKRSTPEKVQYEIPFHKGCGDDDVCDTFLVVSSRFLEIENNTLVAGSRNNLTIEIKVENQGEHAYLTKIHLIVDEYIGFKITPPNCHTNANISLGIICDIGDPIEEGGEAIFKLELDVTKLSMLQYQKYVKLNVSVTTSSNNKNERSSEIIKLRLKREYFLVIFGDSVEKNLYYQTSNGGKVNFTQLYQVVNKGSFKVEEVKIEIRVPYKLQVKDGFAYFLRLLSYQGSLDHQPIKCLSDYEGNIPDDYDDDKNIVKREVSLLRKRSADVDTDRTFPLGYFTEKVIYSNVVCVAGPFKPNSAASLRLKMTFNGGAIQDFLPAKNEKLNISVITNGRISVQSKGDILMLDESIDSADVANYFTEYVEYKIPFWIIILAILLGICLLALLIFGLHKAGFFKRTKKEELSKMKAEAETEDLAVDDDSDNNGLEEDTKSVCTTNTLDI